MSERMFRFCPRCAAPLGERDEGGRPRRACQAQGCGFVYYDNPLPVVAALVELDGKVILARGRGWPPGMFGLITGFLERDEAPADGALRELREELGLEGRIAGLIGAYSFPQRNELIVAYHVEARGEVALNEEIEEIKRVDPARLKPWPFGTGLAVADWVARRSNP
jgi:NADH pyrophosphatase NudC (nudix superfamily)